MLLPAAGRAAVTAEGANPTTALRLADDALAVERPTGAVRAVCAAVAAAARATTGAGDVRTVCGEERLPGGGEIRAAGCGDKRDAAEGTGDVRVDAELRGALVNEGLC
mmetsp:Transcript_85084/g.194018  ORF Transcript_85084/g.194018 Transcript_85084/m.194018 type:complete len:108 (-) Transcript_85084:748-1071(-)